MDISIYKKSLEQERNELEGELRDLGRKNPSNPSDWEPTAADLNIDQAEVEERASEIESFEGRSAIEFEIEERYRDVVAALERIDAGTYGHCLECGNAIAPERLGAYPAAKTCALHMK